MDRHTVKDFALDIYRRLNNKHPYENSYPRDPLEPIETVLIRFGKKVAAEVKEKTLETAAKICEDNDEMITLRTNKLWIQKKVSTNFNGQAYAEAIRALKK